MVKHKSQGRTCHDELTIDYRLDGLGLNPGGDEIFCPIQTSPGAHTASCKMGTGSFLG